MQHATQLSATRSGWHGVIRKWYAPVGVAAATSLSAVIGAFDAAGGHGVETAAIAGRMRSGLGLADRYIDA